MPSTPFSRISVTLPPELLAIADQLAHAFDRPRSWVIAEAIRRMGEGQASGPQALWPAHPRETTTPAAAASEGTGDVWLDQLRADLRLSPTERVRASERAVASSLPGGESTRDSLLSFERYEDFLAWDARARGER